MCRTISYDDVESVQIVQIIKQSSGGVICEDLHFSSCKNINFFFCSKSTKFSNEIKRIIKINLVRED
jgi:hypothetical protein